MSDVTFDCTRRSFNDYPTYHYRRDQCRIANDMYSISIEYPAVLWLKSNRPMFFITRLCKLNTNLDYCERYTESTSSQVTGRHKNQETTRASHKYHQYDGPRTSEEVEDAAMTMLQEICIGIWKDKIRKALS